MSAYTNCLPSAVCPEPNCLPSAVCPEPSCLHSDVCILPSATCLEPISLPTAFLHDLPCVKTAHLLLSAFSQICLPSAIYVEKIAYLLRNPTKGAMEGKQIGAIAPICLPFAVCLETLLLSALKPNCIPSNVCLGPKCLHYFLLSLQDSETFLLLPTSYLKYFYLFLSFNFFS